MTASSQITGIVIFEVTFLTLLSLFRLTQPTFANQINTITTQVFAPFSPYSPPSKVGSTQVGFPACLLYLPSCFGTQVTDTISLIVYSLAYIGYLGFAFLTRIVIMG